MFKLLTWASSLLSHNLEYPSPNIYTSTHNVRDPDLGFPEGFTEWTRSLRVCEPRCDPKTGCWKCPSDYEIWRWNRDRLTREENQKKLLRKTIDVDDITESPGSPESSGQAGCDVEDLQPESFPPPVMSVGKECDDQDEEASDRHSEVQTMTIGPLNICDACQDHLDDCSCHPYTDCDLRPSQCTCNRCAYCKYIREACVCCQYCGDRFCGCVPCGQCSLYPGDCECIPCSKRHSKKDICRCEFCKRCGYQGLKCVCDPCSACMLQSPSCTCDKCKQCESEWAAMSWNEVPPRSDDKPCGICARRFEECNCHLTEDNVHEVGKNSSSIQIFQPQPVFNTPNSSHGYRVVAIVGNDVRVLVVPSWPGIKRRIPMVLHRFAVDIGMRTLIRQTMYWCTVLSRNCQHLKAALVGWWIGKPYVEVTSPRQLRAMLSRLAKVPHNIPNLSLDVEGNDLGRHGTTCYLQIRDCHHQITYLVDILVLGQKAFTTKTWRGLSLKFILESTSIKKLVFDCRQDSNALFSHFGIKLAGVIDIQYMAMLSLTQPPQSRWSLSSVVSCSAKLSWDEEQRWRSHRCFDFVNNYAVFEKRPCPEGVKRYAVNDVLLLQRLYENLKSGLTDRAMQLMMEWTEREIKATWNEDYESLRAFLPSGFDSCWTENLHITEN